MFAQREIEGCWRRSRGLPSYMLGRSKVISCYVFVSLRLCWDLDFSVLYLASDIFLFTVSNSRDDRRTNILFHMFMYIFCGLLYVHGYLVFLLTVVRREQHWPPTRSMHRGPETSRGGCINRA